MKKLLQSKKFKQNLSKWIISYLIVIGMFATVVTYSKYISSMNSRDRAKAATFDAHISYVGLCQNNNEYSSCEYDSIRPTEKVNINFKIDPTPMEVSNFFITYIYVDNNFKVDNLYLNGSNTPLQKNVDYTVSGSNVIKIEETLNPSNIMAKDYKLVLSYDYEKYDKNFDQKFSKDGIVRIAWSAIQID